MRKPPTVMVSCSDVRTRSAPLNNTSRGGPASAVDRREVTQVLAVHRSRVCATNSLMATIGSPFTDKVLAPLEPASFR